MRTAILALAVLGLAAGCGGGTGDPATADASPRSGIDPAVERVVGEWHLPAMLPGSALPDLVATDNGRLLLSWVNSQRGRRHILQFSSYDLAGGRWEMAPTTIAVGNSMFVNWADTPHVMATPDGALWAHWLQKNGDAPYAYDVWLARSHDGGRNWGTPVRPHDDGTLSEHGFVSMWPQDRSTLGIAWLDGRRTVGPADTNGAATTDGPDGPANTDGPATTGDPADTNGSAGSAHAGHGADADVAVDGADPGSLKLPHALHPAHPAHAPHPGGAMTLRAATFDGALRKLDEAEVDTRVCDCCQTDAAMTSRGALLVWRGRAEGEVRDILHARLDAGGWTAPRPVHADGWVMPACPVNGPAVDADGETAVVAWYTAADGDVPEVRAAITTDAGDRFSDPVTVDRGDAVLGRVDVALGDGQAWVLWLREEAEGQSLWVSRRSPDLATEHQRIEVARLAGRGRGTGFPQLALAGGVAYVVWTDVEGGVAGLRAARIAAP